MARARSEQDEQDANCAWFDEDVNVQQSRVGSFYTSDGAHLSIITRTANRKLGVLLLAEI
jgi:hypothetical protein